MPGTPRPERLSVNRVETGFGSLDCAESKYQSSYNFFFLPCYPMGQRNTYMDGSSTDSMHPAEPGTGTQVALLASPPDADDDKPCTYRANGHTWKVGHDYFDSRVGDLCELSEVVGVSSWCDTGDAKDGNPKLIFTYERYEGWHGNQVTIDPYSRNFDEDRFIERYTAPLKPGQPTPPW